MKPLAHERAVLIAAPLWSICLLWLWPRAARAEALSAEIWRYDWASMGYACLLGLMGGALSLIVALATDRRVVVEVLREGTRNAIVSPIAGAGAYAGLKTLAALGWFTASTEPRFLVIVAAGYAGIASIEWARAVGGKLAAAAGEWLVNRGGKP